MTRYVVYDVFTDAPFGGNQLAVILDATALHQAQLQKIAREFNFSETTFVYPPDNPAHTAKVRIFTPTMEVPFAGHPTIGTAIALRDQGATGNMVLELGVGPIPCRVTGQMASFTVSAPLQRFGTPDPALVVKALGLPRTAIRTQTHPPVQAGVGLDFVLVELVDKAALAAIQTNIAAFREGMKRYPSGLDFAVFAYVRDGERIDARMFAPLDNIPEDPATGSASAALAALLTEELGRDLSLKIHQGEAMGRPSHIQAQTTKGDAIAVTISGNAVRTMEGRLIL
ncbi:PhzF family phenazine biosynthesis protein [Yoonia sp.]|uniref:PhzF family phenazine biosynthesis protein n=1 Tax=Yoonia sp. TaxID=2212373 RepID=UPI002FD954D0